MDPAPLEQGIMYAPRVTYRRGDDVVKFFGTSHVANQAFFADLQRDMVNCPRGFYEEVGLFEGSIAQEKQTMATQLPSTSRTYERLADILGASSQSVLEYPVGWERADMSADQIVNTASFESLQELIDLGQNMVFGVGMLELACMFMGKEEILRNVASTLGAESQVSSLIKGILIDQRNAYAISVMEESGLTSFGIAYGSDHLEGIGEWLESDGYGVTSCEWVPSLDMREHLKTPEKIIVCAKY